VWIVASNCARRVRDGFRASVRRVGRFRLDTSHIAELSLRGAGRHVVGRRNAYDPRKRGPRKVG
jgi:hypothetical protein